MKIIIAIEITKNNNKNYDSDDGNIYDDINFWSANHKAENVITANNGLRESMCHFFTKTCK